VKIVPLAFLGVSHSRFQVARLVHTIDCSPYGGQIDGSVDPIRVFSANQPHPLAAFSWWVFSFPGGVLAQRLLNNFFHIVGERRLVTDAFQLISN
jgi:hypothetical protein